MNQEIIVKNFGYSIIESFPIIGPFITRNLDNIESKTQTMITESRLNILETEIKKIGNYQKELDYFRTNESKYLIIKRYINNLVFNIDPALVDTNVNMFVDYVREKKTNDEYDILLEKIVFLNKYSLKVLKNISKCTNDRDYYHMDELMKFYPTIDPETKFYEILNKSNKSEEELELSYGLKSLIDNGFVSSNYTNYPGSINQNIISMLQITGIGYILLNYID